MNQSRLLRRAEAVTGDPKHRSNGQARMEAVATELTDQVAVIPGGTIGIGEATAPMFVEADVRVVIAGNAAEKGTTRAEDTGAQAPLLRTYVRNEDQVHELIEFALAEFGQIDHLFNNAGETGPGGGIADLDSDDFDDAITVLLKSVFLTMEFVAMPRMAGASGPEARVPDEAMAAVEQHRAHMPPMLHAGMPDEIGAAVRFLAIDAASSSNARIW